MGEVKWSQIALDDIDEIRTYIWDDSPYYAERVASALFSRPDILQTHPKIGRAVPELSEDESLRELIEKHYRIIYRIKSVDSIVIVRVLHSARKFPDTV